jgi:hypothetical protein
MGSSVTHAGAGGLLQSVALPEETRASDEVLGQVVVKPHVVLQVVVGAAFAYAAAFERLLDLNRWDPEMWLRWKLEAMRSFQHVVQAAHAEDST